MAEAADTAFSSREPLSETYSSTVYSSPAISILLSRELAYFMPSTSCLPPPPLLPVRGSYTPMTILWLAVSSFTPVASP